MNTNEMTTGEMMIHFRIAEQHYELFAKWLTNNAYKLELISPNNTKKIRKIYLVDKVERLFPNKEIFNTCDVKEDIQAAAELLSDTIQKHKNWKVPASEIIKIAEKQNDKRIFLATIQNYLIGMSKWYEDTERHRHASYLHETHCHLYETKCERIQKRMHILSWLWVALLIVNILLTILL